VGYRRERRHHSTEIRLTPYIPDCAEMVKPDAAVCRYCGVVFDNSGSTAPGGEAQVQKKNVRRG